ncbi:MAG TPA: catalase [Bacteriovoracaceae bacterium]|nr:catalase [Bacteriovoracaceae bacterium]
MKNIILSSLTLTVLTTFNVSAKSTLTRDTGAPVGDNQNSQTAGATGPVILQDSHLIEKLARFDRERIPERVVHARGTGVFGEFVSYGGASDLTKAALFANKGIKTPVFVRFSTVIHGNHSPETLRDPRGFATKFFTKEGNWDLVGNNFPVFFIRDAMKFPDMVHSLKPDPVTNQQDAARIFDFFSHVPEATNMLTFLFSDQATPASYRMMDGNGVHAFKFVNKKGEVRYVKFHWISQQGHKDLTQKEANEIQGKEFNHLTKDLYTEINKGNFPSWELEAQILEPSELDNFDFNPLDATKEWIRIPNLKRVKLGKMTLSKVPDNFFEATEQSAFSPNVLVPGIEPSEDRLLQGRLFSYSDTQRYRLGANFQMLPVNRPRTDVNNYNQNGVMNYNNTKTSINYQPNSFDGTTDRTSGVLGEDDKYKMSHLPLSGTTMQSMIKKTLNFRQAGETYRSFSEADKTNLISNLNDALGGIKNEKVKYQITSHFYCADTDYGTRLANTIKINLDKVKKICEGLKDE